MRSTTPRKREKKLSSACYLHGMTNTEVTEKTLSSEEHYKALPEYIDGLSDYS